jgi:hypothetical protein
MEMMEVMEVMVETQLAGVFPQSVMAQETVKMVVMEPTADLGEKERQA